MLTKIFGTITLVLVLHVWDVNCYSGNVALPQKNIKTRQKRQQLSFPFLPYFEYNSCYALAVVLSVPLELPASRSVFMSYNFETNYYYAYFDNTDGLVPVPFTYIIEPGTNAGTLDRVTVPPGFRKFSDDAGEGNFDNNKQDNTTEEIVDRALDTNEAKKSATDVVKTKKLKNNSSKTKQEKAGKSKTKTRKIRGILDNYFMSRRRFFKMMESKMDRSGLKGSECLLKAICETAEESFGLHNGVIGSVMDILFLPSASKDEKLPKRYYRAETDGISRNCTKYDKACPLVTQSSMKTVGPENRDGYIRATLTSRSLMPHFHTKTNYAAHNNAFG